jgi:hypothetical protein
MVHQPLRGEEMQRAKLFRRLGGQTNREDDAEDRGAYFPSR